MYIIGSNAQNINLNSQERMITLLLFCIFATQDNRKSLVFSPDKQTSSVFPFLPTSVLRKFSSFPFGCVVWREGHNTAKGIKAQFHFNAPGRSRNSTLTKRKLDVSATIFLTCAVQMYIICLDVVLLVLAIPFGCWVGDCLTHTLQ